MREAPYIGHVEALKLFTEYAKADTDAIVVQLTLSGDHCTNTVPV